VTKFDNLVCDDAQSSLISAIAIKLSSTGFLATLRAVCWLLIWRLHLKKRLN